MSRGIDMQMTNRYPNGFPYKKVTYYSYFLRALMLLDENTSEGRRTSAFHIYSIMETATARGKVWLAAMLEGGFVEGRPRGVQSGPGEKPGFRYYDYYITEKGRNLMVKLEDILRMIEPENDQEKRYGRY